MALNNEFIFSGKGEVYSYTTIFEGDNAPEGYDKLGPYTVALIRLDEGPLITAMLTDLDFHKPRVAKDQRRQRVYIGQPVEMVTRKLKEDGDKGVLVYGYKFRPKLRRAPKNFSFDLFATS